MGCRIGSPGSSYVIWRVKERFCARCHQTEQLPLPDNYFRRKAPVDNQTVPSAPTPSSTHPEGRRRTRYRTAIHSVSPAANRNTFEDHEACFLGVSLDNSSFTPAKFDSMLKWVSRHFSRCTVLIGDSIHRLTLASTRGMNPDQALEHALDLGRQFIHAQQPVLDSYRAVTDFTVVRCSQVQETEEYAEFHYELRTLFAKDDAFRASVEAFGRAYHAKHSPRSVPRNATSASIRPAPTSSKSSPSSATSHAATCPSWSTPDSSSPSPKSPPASTPKHRTNSAI
ncbi:tRNA-dependent cyclodipeptide synthase [Streptomyces sp. NBC_00162]|uniref:tRNA-dependent cyclodipeptide synthase n=1 Tax=Streptomyces sp. NBC_00162 TaxID=2903629 RepID=UPI00214CBD84|nr:tRNA-dependent cyclodipeptide synthase [Streptomyces sp. NBC_00162]UUU38128.1 tRNA-dependent cyclodipeptide synthase [Streptomyces sp. NBC_00162]